MCLRVSGINRLRVSGFGASAREGFEGSAISAASLQPYTPKPYILKVHTLKP